MNANCLSLDDDPTVIRMMHCYPLSNLPTKKGRVTKEATSKHDRVEGHQSTHAARTFETKSNKSPLTISSVAPQLQYLAIHSVQRLSWLFCPK
jgi:hypothetical protein